MGARQIRDGLPVEAGLTREPGDRGEEVVCVESDLHPALAGHGDGPPGSEYAYGRGLRRAQEGDPTGGGESPPQRAVQPRSIVIGTREALVLGPKSVVAGSGNRDTRPMTARPGSSPPLRVLVTDDHPGVRRG